MACFFQDLDGCVFKYGTNDPIDGAIEQIQAWIEQGHQVVFTTGRSPCKETQEILTLKFPKSMGILWQIQNPRVVMNDQGCYALNHKNGEEWKYQSYQFSELGE